MTIQGRPDYLLFDISNMLYRTFYAQTNEDIETISGMASHMALTVLNKYFKAYKPTKQVVMAFDRSSWRKEYTKDKTHLKPYKGNRRQNLTPSQQLKYQAFLQHVDEFESIIKEHTAIITLIGDKLEADDLIAGFVQMHPEDQIIIVSTDSDLSQLLKHENVGIISPATDKPADLSKFDNDPHFYLYQKCIRGDTTDNIQSAYPRVSTKRIKKAFEDPFEHVQLMKETWINQNKEEMLVETMFQENEILINLEKQPSDIKEKICEVITQELQRNRKFSLFHILKFLSKYKLEQIKKGIDNYIPMLSQ